MNEFELIQYGYLGLLAMMLFFGGQSVIAYIKSNEPPKHSVAIIAMYFLLAVAGGISGFFWADKELKSAEAKQSTAAIIQKEISKARERLKGNTEKLYEARNNTLKQSGDVGISREIQEMQLDRANEITKMIELQEKHFENELYHIEKAFSSKKTDKGIDNKSLE